ncbi:MAG: DUF932 domain-containing protein [Richelia sp. RM2_1_2]|nr:DUF932 domain-containing protein [Richelia sp. RM2_1_2]
MAHCIETNDKQEGVEQAWHGLTVIRPDLSTDNCWLNTWDVVVHPLLFADGGKTPFFAFRANDDPKIVVGKAFAESYEPITNAVFLEIIRESLIGTDHRLVSCGSVCNRGRIFASFQIQNLEKFNAGGREFDPFLNFGTSHDGSCVFYANTSNICTVCNNTFSANLRIKGRGINARVKHTKNAPMRLQNVAQIIEAAIGVQAEFANAFSEFEKQKIDKRKAENLFAGFLIGGKEVEKISTRTVNTVAELTNLFARGPGNRGESLADAFSAVTDYYTHESSGGTNRLKQFTSSEFGSGNDKKQEFFSLLQNPAKVEKVMSRGKAVLELV